MLRFHFYEMFRKGKSLQTESGSLVARGCGGREKETDEIGLFREMKMF